MKIDAKLITFNKMMKIYGIIIIPTAWVLVVYLVFKFLKLIML